jgi:hypothetical protein
VPIGILKSSIRSWNLSQSLLINALLLLMHIIIIQLMHSKNYFISKKGLVQECDQKENVEVIGATNTSCLKRRF